ncbi:hypothetical protein J6590_046875 [Homalodisca vitripennis]|nr:hypothetical protein J6590_046875 [Homalodisca vitripennis]
MKTVVYKLLAEEVKCLLDVENDYKNMESFGCLVSQDAVNVTSSCRRIQASLRRTQLLDTGRMRHMVFISGQ